MTRPLPPVDDSGVPEVIKSLSQRQVLFCQYYAMHGRNAYRAALLAGYAVTPTQHSQPYGLLKREDIQAGIAYYEAVFADRTHSTVAKLLHQWATMASFDILDCCNADYSLKPLDELTPDQRERLGQALCGVEMLEKGGKRFVKPQLARVQALEHLGKLLHAYDAPASAGHGLHLNISVGQQVHGATAAGLAVGHLRIYAAADADAVDPSG